MQKENKHEIARNEVCSIISCSDCGAYDLNYRYLRLHLSLDNMNSILQAIYVYETIASSSDVKTPFKFTFGMIALTVYHTDYKQFKDVVEKVVLEEIEVPQALLSSLTHEKNN